MIMTNILGGSFIIFLIISLLVGCILGFRGWKKRALWTALGCAVAYGVCEVLLYLVQPLRIMPADMLFMFGGYICVGLAVGALCGGCMRMLALKIKR